MRGCVLQHVAVRAAITVPAWFIVLQCGSVWYSVSQCNAVRCSVRAQAKYAYSSLSRSTSMTS